MKPYYQIAPHSFHVHSGVHLANENFESIRGILYPNQKVEQKKLYFIADEETKWEKTLANMDMIESQGIIISKRLKEAIEHLIYDHAQIIPVEIYYKGNIYKDFFHLHPHHAISVVNFQKSRFKPVYDGADFPKAAFVKYLEYYDISILEEIYAHFPHYHIAYEVFSTPRKIISQDIYKIIKKNKFKVATKELVFNIYANYDPNEHEAYNATEDLFNFIKKRLSRAYNYSYLKDKFNL